MTFKDNEEEIIERAVHVLNTEQNTIREDFTRYNTIYVGNIKEGRVIFELQLTLPEIARVMGFDLNRFYHDRNFNFIKTLEYRLWHYENINDDSPFIGMYEMDYACHSLELSMFGVMPRWIPGENPAYGTPVINEKGDLAKLKVPNFFTDGFMPQLVEDYFRLKEDLKGRIKIGIRKNVQGPFQLASALHGQEKILTELITDPSFVCDLMEFCFIYHKEWVKGWEELHGEKYGTFNLGEDEIDTRLTVRPSLYRKLIYPLHKRYGECFEGIHWHSCGDTNEIFHDIAAIPNMRVVEIGPYDDVQKVAQLFVGSQVRFYKCPDPVNELYSSNSFVQEKMIESVLRASELVPIKILCEADNLEKGLVFLRNFKKIAGYNN